MASRPRSSPIAPSAATADSRTSGSSPRPAPPASASRRLELVVGDSLVLAARPCRDLDHGRVDVVQQRDQRDVDVAGRDRGRPAAHGGVAVAERCHQFVVAEAAESLERAQRAGAHGGLGRIEAQPGRRLVAGVPGRGDRPPGRLGHCLSRSVSVVTIIASANAVTVAMTAPMTMARPPLATAANSRRIGPAA